MISVMLIMKCLMVPGCLLLVSGHFNCDILADLEQLVTGYW